MKNLGVQSYCFREFTDNNIAAQKVRELGLQHIELCGVHADFDHPETFVEVVETYKSHGVSIASIGVQTFVGDDRERSWFECAHLAGAGHISCHFAVDSFTRAIPKVRKWAREFGIKVGIHCHGGYMFGGQRDVMNHLLALGSPEIGLCIDTAWAMQIGPGPGNPVEWLTYYTGSVFGLHFKDFVFERNGQWQDAIVGTGNLDLPAFMATLKETGFDGMAVLEYEGDASDPVPALRSCANEIGKYL